MSPPVAPSEQHMTGARAASSSCGDAADAQLRHAALVARGRALLQSYRERRPRGESDQELRLQSAAVNGEPHESDATAKTQQLLTTSANGNNSSGGGVPVKEIGSWSELVHVQLQNTLLLDAMEMRVLDLHANLSKKQEIAPHLAQECGVLSQLVQQKRVVEDAMVSFTAAMGPPLVLDSDTDESGDEEQPVPLVNADKTQATGKKSRKWISQQQLRDLVDAKTEALQRELDESKMFITDLKAKVHAYKSESAQPNGKLRSVSADSDIDEPPAAAAAAATEKEPNDDAYHEYYVAGAEREIRKLQSALIEKEGLLMSLRTSLEHVMQDHGRLEQELKRSRVAIDQISAERNHTQKAAADAKALLTRAYSVKARQLEQLCSTIDLPTQWQQVTDAKNGILYFQQRGHAPQLEDPRVPLAIRQYNIARKALSASSSPRSSSGHSEAQDRRSSSESRHESVDLSTAACEDIPEPPDDGCKHQIDDFATPLPEGWEMRATAAGSVFFVNRQTNVTTWNDPRETQGGGQSKAPGSLCRVKIPFAERKQARGGHENTVTSYRPSASDLLSEEDGVQYFDVVFKERGPIGIHFQANSPDAGATVRRLLPGTAAINTGILRPFDRLIAVNHNPVDTASFRHVMILLQGGLRPLTLTFKRELQQQRGETGSASTNAQSRRTQSASVDADLDEEVVLDAGGDEHETAYQSTQRRRSSRELLHRRPSAQDVTNQRDGAPARAAAASSASHDGDADDDSVADKIITNLFSFFWTPPDPVTGEVQTV